MLKGLSFAAFIVAASLGTVCFAQSSEEIRKEVRMEDENGVKTLHIITTINGVTTEEIFTGEAADARLAEEMNGRGNEDAVRKEVMVTEENGETVVTIVTSTQGKIRTEVFTGEDAKLKLKELEEEENGGGELHHQSAQPSVEENK